MRWYFYDDLLVLQNGWGVSPPFHLIETEGFEEIGYCTFAIGYDQKRTRVISYETDPESGESYIGYFLRHNVYTLRGKALSALDGMRLTEEERSRYEID